MGAHSGSRWRAQARQLRTSYPGLLSGTECQLYLQIFGTIFGTYPGNCEHHLFGMRSFWDILGIFPNILTCSEYLTDLFSTVSSLYLAFVCFKVSK